MYRQISQYYREHTEYNIIAIEHYLSQLLIELSQAFPQQSALDWKDEILSALDLTDTNTFEKLVDPIPWDDRNQTVYNEISRSSSQYRDEYILERISSLKDEYKKIFVVYGSAHAVKLEKALEVLYASE